MRRPPAAAAPDPDDLTPEVHRRVGELRRWGLGWGEEPEGYRRRLRDLCRFLQEIKGGGDGPEGDSARIRGAVARTNRGRDDPERDARLRRLEDLAPALRELAGERERLREHNGQDAVRACLERLAGWTLRPRPGEPQAAFDSRGAFLERPLALLGALRVFHFGPREESPLDHLMGLKEALDALPAATPDALRGAAWDRLRERLEDCLADWEWACVQVQVEIARLYEEAAPGAGAGGLAALKRAYAFLADALARLERGGFRQLRAQGLYGLMARVCLRRVAAGDEPAFLQEALGHAYRGVELDPESAAARLVLVEALAALGDYDTLVVEAEVAYHLDPGPETFRVTGASYWQRSAALRDRKARRQVLDEAAGFFTRTLGQLESSSFDDEAPLRLMEAHGWAHFWLGRFESELGRGDEAVAHLRIACRLGFKPLEARVELAWACLLARDARQAERAFAEAAAEILRRRTGVLIAPLPGEEREIDDLDFDVHLGWALLSADWVPARFDERLAAARQLLPALPRPGKEDLEAALREAQGLADFRAGRLPEAIAELKSAIETSARPGAYCYLGLAEAETARGAEGKEREAALRRAKRARDLARETDLRERHQRELGELDAVITQLAAPPPAAVPPPKPPPAGTGGGAAPGTSAP